MIFKRLDLRYISINSKYHFSFAHVVPKNKLGSITTVLLESSSTIINLLESLVTSNDPSILQQKATLFWEYNDINDDIEILYNNQKKIIKK